MLNDLPSVWVNFLFLESSGTNDDNLRHCFTDFKSNMLGSKKKTSISAREIKPVHDDYLSPVLTEGASQYPVTIAIDQLPPMHESLNAMG